MVSLFTVIYDIVELFDRLGILACQGIYSEGLVMLHDILIIIIIPSAGSVGWSWSESAI
jgi:hypothetical protein